MKKQNYLVVFDTDKIHSYVFGTNVLKEIRGASALLDNLNEHETKKLLGNYSAEEIYIGGGAGKIIFNIRKEATEFCAKLAETYSEATGNSASITSVVSDYDDEDFKNSIIKAEAALRAKKLSKKVKFTPITCSYFKTCTTTGVLPADYYENRHFISNSSKIKVDVSNKNTFYHQFYTWLNNSDNDNLKEKWGTILGNYSTPNDLNAIGKINNGYIGLIYADGNRMGQRFKDKKQKNEYKKLSDTIKTGIKNSIYYALATELTPQSVLPFEILLLGGDDLIAVVQANKTFDVANAFARRFKTETGVSISIGMLYSHANFPIHLLIDYSEQLLRSAKSLASQNSKKDCNCVDFLVIKNPVVGNILSLRKKDYTGMNSHSVNLINRPYTFDDLEMLVQKAHKLKAENFPKTKLKYMYESLFKDFNQATLDYCLLLTKLPQNIRNVLITNFLVECELYPWKLKDDVYTTDILDMIELYDFI